MEGWVGNARLSQATLWFPHPYSSYSWTATWTGRCPTGWRCSQPVFLGFRHVHPAHLLVGVKQVPGVLSPSVPTAVPRLQSVLFICWPLLCEGSRADNQAVPGAVFHTQIALGLGDLRMMAMSQLKLVTKGYKKSVPNHSRTRLPITPRYSASYRLNEKSSRIGTTLQCCGLHPVCASSASFAWERS